MSKITQQSRLEAMSQRGEAAARLLSDPLLIHELEQMEADAVMALKRVKSDDVEGRDAAWRDLLAAERFVTKLRQHVTYGNQARKTLLQRVKEHI